MRAALLFLLTLESALAAGCYLAHELPTEGEARVDDEIVSLEVCWAITLDLDDDFAIVLFGRATYGELVWFLYRPIDLDVLGPQERVLVFVGPLSDEVDYGIDGWVEVDEHTLPALPREFPAGATAETFAGFEIDGTIRGQIFARGSALLWSSSPAAGVDRRASLPIDLYLDFEAPHCSEFDIAPPHAGLPNEI